MVLKRELMIVGLRVLWMVVVMDVQLDAKSVHLRVSLMEIL